MKKKKLSKKSILIMAFLILSLIFSTIICYVCYSHTKSKLENTKQFIISEQSKIQYAIQSRVQSAKTLEIDVVSHGGRVSDFDEVCKFLCEDDTTIRSLQLAPNGVVQYVYPLEGNEEAFIDLLNDPQRKADAQLAKDTGEIIISGPFELSQGGMGLVARNPIYMEMDEGHKEFWGFSIVILNVPEIFDIANLDLLTDQKYYYRIWKNNPATGEVQVIVENTDTELNNAKHEEIKVLNATWQLDIAPRDKWVSRSLIYIQIIMFTIILILAMAALSNYLTVCEQREELIRQKEELIWQNETDAVTGLKNRKYFMDKLNEYVTEKKPCAVFFIDLDKFKEVNDNFGHDEGDKLIVEASKRIAKCTKDTDVAARIGGDEFTIIASDITCEQDCLNFRMKIKDEISKPHAIKNITFYPSASIGFAIYPSESEEIEEVIRIADQRMYKEKRKSKEMI